MSLLQSFNYAAYDATDLDVFSTNTIHSDAFREKVKETNSRMPDAYSIKQVQNTHAKQLAQKVNTRERLLKVLAKRKAAKEKANKKK